MAGNITIRSKVASVIKGVTTHFLTKKYVASPSDPGRSRVQIRFEVPPDIPIENGDIIEGEISELRGCFVRNGTFEIFAGFFPWILAKPKSAFLVTDGRAKLTITQ